MLVVVELLHSLAVSQKRTRQALQQRNRELAALNAVTATITATLELDQVLQRLVNTVDEIFPQAIAATIQLLDERDGTLQTHAASGGAIPVPEKIIFRPGEGAAGLALDERRPINIADVTSDPRYLLGVIPPVYRSLLVAPLVVGQRVWGTLSVEGEVVGAFQDRDERLIASLAQHAAIAIENARLYAETRRRLTETTVLQTLSTAVATLDFDQVSRQAIETLHRALGIERLDILLPDETARVLRPAPGGSIGFRADLKGGLVEIPIENSASGQVCHTGQSVLLTDVSTASNYYCEMEDTRSELCVPIKSGDRVIGVLNAESPRLAAFDDHDRRLLEAVGAQLAVALDNARLYEETARHARQQATVAQVARALNASLDVERAFPAIVEGLRNLVDAERVSLILFDRERPQFSIAALASPLPGLDRRAAFSYSEGAVISSLKAGRVHLTPDLVGEDADPIRQKLIQAGFRSSVNLPLIVGERVIGALNLASRQWRAFTEGDLPVLQQIADAMAVAIVNSQLHAETARRLAEVRALTEASTQLTAHLEPEATLTALVEQAQAALGVDRVAVYLFDQQADRFLQVRAFGLSDEYLDGMQQFYYDLPDYQILSGQPVWIERAQEDGVVGPLQELIRREGYQTAVLLPLPYRDRVIGGLSIYFDQVRARDQALLDLAQAFANQAAVALGNARLFDLVRAAEAQYRGLFEGSTDPIAILDAQGAFLDVNPAACRVLGRSREVLLGQPAYEINPQDETMLLQMTARVLAGEVIRYEFNIIIEGQVRHFEACVERVGYAGGEALQWSARDVTARRELDHWREELTSITIHNLRNPLTWVKTGAEMVQMFLPQDIDSDVVLALKKVIKGSARLEQQIDVLLNINRAEAGQELTDQQPLSPVSLVTDVIDLLGPRAAIQKIQLQAELPESLPMVWGNRNMLASTLENLVDNAIKFSPPDGIVTIRASVDVRPKGKGGETGQSVLCFSVIDQGPGIPLTERELIFQKFYQARRPEGIKGSGLGLYFCRLAVQAHGGWIGVESGGEGQGSVFSFTLPM